MGWYRRDELIPTEKSREMVEAISPDDTVNVSVLWGWRVTRQMSASANYIIPLCSCWIRSNGLWLTLSYLYKYINVYVFIIYIYIIAIESVFLFGWLPSVPQLDGVFVSQCLLSGYGCKCSPNVLIMHFFWVSNQKAFKLTVCANK